MSSRVSVGVGESNKMSALKECTAQSLKAKSRDSASVNLHKDVYRKYFNLLIKQFNVMYLHVCTEVSSI